MTKFGNNPESPGPEKAFVSGDPGQETAGAIERSGAGTARHEIAPSPEDAKTEPEKKEGRQGKGGEAPEEELILGKFRSVKDLARAYKHLESKLGELGGKASLIEKVASRWADASGRRLAPEEFVRLAEETLVRAGIIRPAEERPTQQTGESDDRVISEIKERLAEYDALIGQIYLEKEREKVKSEYPDLDDEALDFCIAHASPDESPSEIARFIVKQRRAGVDAWAQGKARASQLLTDRGSGAAVPPVKKRISFRGGRDAVTPLEAWMARPEE